MTKKQVQITDPHELQNLLDDYSTDRPYLNAYEADGGVFADEDELLAWRAKGKILTRAQAIAAAEPEGEPEPPEYIPDPNSAEGIVNEAFKRLGALGPIAMDDLALRRLNKMLEQLSTAENRSEKP